MATTSGPVELERPRVRDASKLGFESRVLGKGVTRTYALESLGISSFPRGLSTRDVEAVLEETLEAPVSSRSTVSRISARTPGSATGAGADDGSMATTSSTCSWTPSI